MQKDSKKIALVLVWIVVIPAFVAGQVSFWRENSKIASAQVVDTAAVEDTQDSISDLQKKIDKEEAAKKKLEASLGQLSQAVSSTQAAINKTKSAIQEAEATIDRKQAEIDNLNEKIRLQKEMLKVFMQQIYYVQSQPILNVVLNEGTFADFFGDADHLLTIEEKIRNVSSEIAQTKTQIQQDTEQLAQEKEKHEDLLDQKTEQKNELLADKNEVAADVAEKEATIGELQAKLDELKSDLSSLLGKNLSTNDIVEAAGIASKATGVRKDFILGELVVETNLGTFTGGCTYKNIRMKPADKAAFLTIAEELEKAYGGNYKNKKLSCSPGYGYGGAMGVAQFMPTTWTGYKSYIASATGHKPPDPWSVIDGVMGMAKKLANGGATSRSGEKLASKRYYCGGPSSPYWNNKCNTYANNVQYWADNYEKKL